MGRSQIVIVDDNAVNIQILMQFLKDDYKLIPFTSITEALSFLEHKDNIDMVLLDIDMSELNGYSAFQALKRLDNAKDLPVIFITARADVESELMAFDLGIVDYIKKPLVPKLAKKRIDYHLNARIKEKRILEEAKKIKKITEVTVKTLTALVDHFDLDSELHIDRIILYVLAICENLIEKGTYESELTLEFIENIKLAAPFHDCGKLFVDDNLLLKRGKLTPEEFEKVKLHTVLGSRVLKNARSMMGEPSFFDMAEVLALYYRECWDGSGYPFGLRGSEIPLCARIMAVADVYDALVHIRPYKEAYSHEVAVKIIVGESGTSFDPNICEAFFSANKTFNDILVGKIVS